MSISIIKIRRTNGWFYLGRSCRVLSRRCSSGESKIMTRHASLTYRSPQMVMAWLYLHYVDAASYSLTVTRYYSNKWVLNTTAAPLFFLLVQLIIAVVLFLISDAIRILPDRLTFDLNVCKGLVPMVGLNIVGLRCVSRTASFTNLVC